jgi:hypothetical protein
VVLQNSINLLEVVPGSYSESCYAAPHVIYIKTEDFTDEEEEESHVPIPSPVIKAECEVSCVCVYIVIHISQIYSIAYCLYHLHSGEWNLRSSFRYI